MTPLLSRQQAAAFLGVPPATLAAWAYRGTGPRYYRIGRWARYAEEDLITWVDRRAVETDGAGR